MLSESTVLAAVAFLLAETLEKDYGLDPAPLLAAQDIPRELASKPGSRVPKDKMQALWVAALELTNDSTLGIKVGSRASLSTYYVLGHAWHASRNLVEAIERLIRYDQIIHTSDDDTRLEKQGDVYRLSERYSGVDTIPRFYVLDAEIAGFLKLCELVKGRRIYPLNVEMMAEQSHHPAADQELYRAPVAYGSKENAMYFDAAELEEPLPTAIPDIAEASDRIAERYTDSLDKNKTAGQVRSLLIQMLPSGSADQEAIASRLYRSSSTLQRQLQAEGTSYREVLESTRSKLAEEYLKQDEHSHAQIAYLLGFSDQSNFSRAFKRWTGMSPGQFQKSLA
jgi:AraC-like DNA-binding protein